MTASIIIVTYNSKPFLDACLNSLRIQDYPHEIIIVDNFSNDNTLPYIKEKFPEVKIINNSSNSGYGAGNNLGVKHARGRFIVILNPDTIVQERWLSELISPLESEKNLITTPKILTYDGFTINTCGIISHFTGLHFTRGLGLSPDQFMEPLSTGGISGACFAMRREDFFRMGGFDESFFMYNEDSDLTWRAYQKMYCIRYIPDSIINHHYTLKVSSEKFFHLEKGRYMLLRKNYSYFEMLLLLPSFLVTEALTWGYSIKLGKKGIKSKIRSMKEGIFYPVQLNQENKKNLLIHLDTRIPDTQLITNGFEKRVIQLGNIIFSLNFSVLK